MHHPKGTQVVLGDQRMFCEEQYNRGNNPRDRDLIVFHDLAELLQVKSLHDMCGDTSIKWSQKQDGHNYKAL